MTNAIEQLKAQIAHRLGESSASLDVPVQASRGAWWLDIEEGDRRVVVEWKPGTEMFGISLVKMDAGLGEPADEWIATVESAANRVLQLLGARRVGRSQAAR